MRLAIDCHQVALATTQLGVRQMDGWINKTTNYQKPYNNNWEGMWGCAARACMLCHVWLFATSWTVACQAPLSMPFPRKEYRSGLPFPTPRDLPDPWFEPASPALQVNSLPLSQLGGSYEGKEHKLIWKWKVLLQSDIHCCSFQFLLIKICYYVKEKLGGWFMICDFYNVNNNYIYFFFSGTLNFTLSWGKRNTGRRSGIKFHSICLSCMWNKFVNSIFSLFVLSSVIFCSIVLAKAIEFSLTENVGHSL